VIHGKSFWIIDQSNQCSGDTTPIYSRRDRELVTERGIGAVSDHDQVERTVALVRSFHKVSAVRISADDIAATQHADSLRIGIG
jgi:hypothetical protein